MILNKTAKEIAEKSRSEFFPNNDGTLTQVLKDMGKFTRVPLLQLGATNSQVSKDVCTTTTKK